MGKWKKYAKIGLATLGLGTAGYYTSPKLGYITHEVRTTLFDTLGRIDILQDQETNDIIDLMSGTITQENLSNLLKRYHQEQHIIHVDSLGIKSEAFKKVVLLLQTKYGNPKINLDGNFFNPEKWKYENDRARFDFFSNTMSLFKADSSDIFIRLLEHRTIKGMLDHSINLRDFTLPQWQKDIYTSWIAELSHAKQLKENGTIKSVLKTTHQSIGSLGNYNKLYDEKGSFEYQAHTIYQPGLVRELHELLWKIGEQSKDPNVFLFLALLNNVWSMEYETECYDKNLMHKCLQKAEALGSPLGKYAVAKVYQDAIYQSYDYLMGLDTGMIVETFGEKKTAIETIQSMKEKYIELYNAGDTEAGLRLIIILNKYCWGLEDDFIVQLGENIITGDHKKINKRLLKKLYAIMSNSYFRLNHIELQKKYTRLHDSIEGSHYFYE